MLVHAITLSALLSVSVAVATYLFTGDLGRVAQAVALAVSGMTLFCFRAQWYITKAYVDGRIVRAQYHPRPHETHIIEHVPVPPVSPPVLPAPRESVRFINLYSRSAQHSTNMSAASPVAPPSLKSRFGVDEADLAWFVRGLDTKGSHARRRWEGRVAPSGRVVDAEYHSRLIEPLVSLGAIVGRAERRAGSLVMESSEIRSALELV